MTIARKKPDEPKDMDQHYADVCFWPKADISAPFLLQCGALLSLQDRSESASPETQGRGGLGPL